MRLGSGVEGSPQGEERLRQGRPCTVEVAVFVRGWWRKYLLSSAYCPRQASARPLRALAVPWLQVALSQALQGQPRLASLPLIPPGLCCFELGGELPLFRSVFLCLHTVNPISGPGGAPCQVSSANGHGLSFWYSFDDFGGTGQ